MTHGGRSSQIDVNVPEQPAPVVNVEAPSGETVRTIDRDDKGLIRQIREKRLPRPAEDAAD